MRTRIPFRFLAVAVGMSLALSVAASALATAGTRPDARAGAVGFPYEALKGGAQIYIVTIKATTPISDLNDDFATGRAKLEILESLQGGISGDLLLPYHYDRAPRRMPSDLTWPNLEKLKPGAKLICVVMPKAVDQAVGAAPDTYGAALYVHSVSGDDDPIVVAYKKIIEIDSLKAEDVAAAIQRSIGDASPIVRQYCLEAAWKRLDAPTAISLIAETLRRADKGNATYEEVDMSFSYLFYLGDAPDAKPADITRIVTTLAWGAASSNSNIASESIHLLAYLRSRPGFEAPARFLSAEDQEKLRSSVHPLLQSLNAPERQDAATVLDWIKKPDTRASGLH